MAEHDLSPNSLSAIRFAIAAICFSPLAIKGFQNSALRLAALELGVWLFGANGVPALRSITSCEKSTLCMALRSFIFCTASNCAILTAVLHRRLHSPSAGAGVHHGCPRGLYWHFYSPGGAIASGVLWAQSSCNNVGSCCSGTVWYAGLRTWISAQSAKLCVQALTVLQPCPVCRFSAKASLGL